MLTGSSGRSWLVTSRPLQYAAVMVWLLAYSTTAYSSSDRPVIFNWTETAQPNDAMGLQGSGFGSASQVWLTRVRGNEHAVASTTRLKVLTNSNIFVAARIPSNLAIGLYAVWIKNLGRESNLVWINRARLSGYEFPQIVPAGTFRLWGRNLAFRGSRSHVWFTDPRNGQSLPGAVVGGDQYILTVVAPPNLVPGVTYRMRVSNGYGGQWGASIDSVAIPVRQSGPDHWHLGVPWAADFDFFGNVYNVKTDPRLAQHAVGDGITNDRPAIQKAIEQAHTDGGGVVYLPPGRYELTLATAAGQSNAQTSAAYGSEQGLTLESRVVLEGAGKDRTIIKYGDEPSPLGACGVAWVDKTAVSGIEGISFHNSNGDGHWMCNIRNLGTSGHELFVHNISADLNTEGIGVAWKTADELLLADSDFTFGPRASMPYTIQQSSWYIVRGNSFRYLRKRMDVDSSRHGLIEGNHSTRDFTMPLIQPGDSGGLEIDSVRDLTVLNNAFDTAGTISSANDGETINSQGCNAPHQDLGSVESASATQIEDLSKHWQSLAGYAVAVVTGLGAGQWRNILSNTSTSLTVDRPWLLIPPTGSKYVITQWSAQTLLIKSNILADNPKGVWMYCGGADVAIVNNALHDSSGIWLRADQRMKLDRFNLLIGAVVADNDIVAAKGNTPAFLTTELSQVESGTLYGTGVYDVEVRHNMVVCNANEPGDGVLANGLWSWVRYVHGGTSETSSDTAVPGIIGTIFQDNHVGGCEYPYNVSTGDRAQVILDPSIASAQVRDRRGRVAGRGASETFVGP